VAVDAHTGELAAFDRDSGVDLVDAVTASTAAPGLVPTVSITARATSTAACALSTTPTLLRLCERRGPLAAERTERDTTGSQFEGLRRFPGADLASQVEGLRKGGSRVEVVTPDAIPEPQWART